MKNDSSIKIPISLLHLSKAAKEHLCITSNDDSQNMNIVFKTTWLDKDKPVYLIATCTNNYIKNLVENIGRGPHRYTYVTDTWGELLYASKETIVEEFNANKKWAIKQPEGVSEKDNNFYHIYNGNNSGFKTITVTDKKATIFDPLKKITINFLFILIGLLITITIIAWFISLLLSRPITKLAKLIENFNIRNDSKKLDLEPIQITELDILRKSFINMANQNYEQEKQIEKEHEILRKTELNVLQEQINPHFLYNTLTSIQWLCNRGENKEAAKMVTTLGQFYRIGLSKGKEFITIRQELQHANSYLTMQEYRFKDQFDWEIIAPDEVMDYLCCRIIIQPFLENALYHGMESEIEKLKITVRVTKEDALYIWIEDDGIGISEKKCQKIMSDDKDISKNDHLGIRNVNDRIQIYFGKEYGITIISEVDVGTTIKIRLPLKK